VETGWAGAGRILCVRLDSMGDVLMTGPAMRALRQSLPGRSITLLTSPSGAEVAGMMPEVDEVIAYRAPWMKPEPGTIQDDLSMIDRLRAGRFHAAVIFTVFSQNPLPAAMLAYLAGVPLRLAHCRENPYALLTDWLPETEPEQGIRHEVQRQLDLVAGVDCRTQDSRLAIRLSNEGMVAVQKLLEECGVSNGRPWLAVHPGATAPSRRYPREGFAAVCRTLALEDGMGIVFTGSDQEKTLVADIQQQMEAPSVSLAGRLSLGQLAALLHEAPMLLSNNTGPVHLAAAVGTPVVDLYALTNPQHTPWQVESRVLSHDVPCRNCFKSICPEGHHLCLRGVGSESVVSAVRQLLRVGRGLHTQFMNLTSP
jgi:lipopolysaccharide heptosyltransferase II